MGVFDPERRDSVHIFVVVRKGSLIFFFKKIKINMAYRIKNNSRRKFRDILVTFHDWSTKKFVTNAIRSSGTINIKGFYICFRVELLSLITLKKSKEIKFLTNKLIKLGIPYR